jgi:hypothetical protein
MPYGDLTSYQKKFVQFIYSHGGKGELSVPGPLQHSICLQSHGARSYNPESQT